MGLSCRQRSLDILDLEDLQISLDAAVNLW